jgi:DNA glycosylase AlkZ-like
VGEPLPSVAGAVRHLVAVQSQDYAGAKWALAQRTAGVDDADIDRAFDAGEVIRTHVLRPTWHFVAPEDLRWLMALTGARIRRGVATRHRFLEIDDDVTARALGAFERAIARDGPRTRNELATELAGVGIEGVVARLVHLLMLGEIEGVLCSGPRRGKAQTYALLEQRVPPGRPRPRDEAVAELAGRYVAGHGPAQAVDLAWWAGLGVGEARRGLEAAEPALEREVIDGRTFWFAPAPTPASAPSIHLLPNYDELYVAFRDRRDALDPAMPAPGRIADAIFDHVIVRDGLVIGRWRRVLGTRAVSVHLEPLVPLDSPDRDRLQQAVERYGIFLGRPTRVVGLD